VSSYCSIASRIARAIAAAAPVAHDATTRLWPGVRNAAAVSASPSSKVHAKARGLLAATPIISPSSASRLRHASAIRSRKSWGDG